MTKDIVIVDIDGTISSVGPRIKHLRQSPVDWDSFYAECFEDNPITEMVELVKYLSRKYFIVFCTGRRESVREVTVAWIKANMGIDVSDTELLMRPNGDMREDSDVKVEQLILSGVDMQRIAFVLEDRSSVVKAWRDRGIRCLQVDKGEF